MIQPKEIMMNKKNPLTIWAKRAIPALALAATAGIMLPGCEKDPIEQKPIYRAPYEKELFFKNQELDSINPDRVKPFAYDTACKHIYLTVKDNNNFTNYDSEDIHNLRNRINKSIELSPDKISGRGDFWFCNGVAAKSDSIWFIQNGWTIRQLSNHR